MNLLEKFIKSDICNACDKPLRGYRYDKKKLCHKCGTKYVFNKMDKFWKGKGVKVKHRVKK